ncbi:retrotransposon protein, putative, ty1-copia subclass [Tanacetum coccineum]
MVPTKKVDNAPYEIWHGKAPNLSYLMVWGYEALMKRDTHNRLESRSVKYIFIGYPKETMGYYFSNPHKNKIFVVHYVEFFESSLTSQEASGSNVDLEIIQEENTQPSKNTTPDRYRFFIDAEEHELKDLNKPLNYKASLSYPGSDKSVKAINTNIDDNVHTFKARLMAKGYTQTYGIDYGETFSPVADSRSIRILLAITAYYDYEIWQMDVKTALLNEHLSEDVYMVQPERFVDPRHPKKVCKLQRSVYGLKQASISKNKKFDEKIKKVGFTHNLDESFVYLEASGSISYQSNDIL